MKKGFTLIELLIVIAIVAVLSVVVLITLNPAELLRQSRDSNRLSDLSSLKSALSLYLADVTIPNLGSNAGCYVSLVKPAAPAGPMALGFTSPVQADATCGARFSGGANNTSTPNPRLTNGTGWIPVDFTVLATGAGNPLSSLPVDPVNALTSNATSTSYYYAYRTGSCSGNSCVEYEVNANMESTKFRHGGTQDVESTDGGNETGYLEMGTDSGLDL